MAANNDWFADIYKLEEKTIRAMDNLDIILLTVLVVISYVAFIGLTAREFNKMSKNSDQLGKEKGTDPN